MYTLIVSHSAISILTSIAGGFFSGIMLRYFLKNIIKMIIFVAGGIIATLLYLQQQQVISVHVEKMEASSTFILDSISSSFYKVTQRGELSILGIPRVGGLSDALAIGLMKG